MYRAENDKFIDTYRNTRDALLHDDKSLDSMLAPNR